MLKTSEYEMSEGYYLTIYPCVAGDENVMKEAMERREFGIIELLIVKALYKYMVLNRKNLERAVDIKLDRKLQKPNYITNIRHLREKGILFKMRYGDEDEANGCEFYSLTAAGYQYMRVYYAGLPVTYDVGSHNERNVKRENLPAIMERLSINQWHINLLRNYGDKICSEAYYSKKRLGYRKAWFQSNVRIKTQAGSVALIALPAGKTEDDKKDLFDTLIRYSDLIGKSENKAAAFIVICESKGEIGRITKYLEKSRTLHDVELLFAVDLNINKQPALEMLYTCMVEQQRVSIDTFEVEL